AASALTVSATGSTDRGGRLVAAIQPPTISTGAAPDESRPHQGTLRTAITVGADHPGDIGVKVPAPGTCCPVRRQWRRNAPVNISLPGGNRSPAWHVIKSRRLPA